jgi:hypothetical protein
MTNEVLKLLQAAVTKRKGQLSDISPVAADLCGIISHEIGLWRYDRDQHQERIKALEEKVPRLDKASQE